MSAGDREVARRVEAARAAALRSAVAGEDVSLEERVKRLEQTNMAAFVEHHLKGCNIKVGDKLAEDGSGRWIKVLVVEHMHDREAWVIEMPLAGAQQVAKGLSTPPRVPGDANGSRVVEDDEALG